MISNHQLPTEFRAREIGSQATEVSVHVGVLNCNSMRRRVLSQ